MTLFHVAVVTQHFAGLQWRYISRGYSYINAVFLGLESDCILQGYSDVTSRVLVGMTTFTERSNSWLNMRWLLWQQLMGMTWWAWRQLVDTIAKEHDNSWWAWQHMMSMTSVGEHYDNCLVWHFMGMATAGGHGYIFIQYIITFLSNKKKRKT